MELITGVCDWLFTVLVGHTIQVRAQELLAVPFNRVSNKRTATVTAVDSSSPTQRV